jgi:aspartyl-tRNA(Asn)/glutamyl-tRNA(Gln) amidotransferase subunit A
MTEIFAEPVGIVASTSQRLADLTFTVKDVVRVRGRRLTAGLGATLLEGGAGENPFVSQMLAEGASCLGIAACAELAFDLSGELGVPTPRNPLGASLQTGGSSSGSAVAVSLGFGDFSIATDTGGSARVPAACCGVIGYKPTSGRLSTDEMVGLSETCDHLALIARTFDVLGRVLGDEDAAGELRQHPILGVPKSYLLRHLSVAAAEWFEALCRALVAAGFPLKIVDLDFLDGVEKTYARIVHYEAFRKYQPLLERNDIQLSDTMRARLASAGQITVDDYVSASTELQRLRDRATEMSQVCSMFILPTLPGPVPLRGQRTVTIRSSETLLRDATLALTAFANLVGAPAIAFPVEMGNHGSRSVQIVGLQGNDNEVIAVARHVGQVSEMREQDR